VFVGVDQLTQRSKRVFRWRSEVIGLRLLHDVGDRRREPSDLADELGSTIVNRVLDVLRLERRHLALDVREHGVIERRANVGHDVAGDQRPAFWNGWRCGHHCPQVEVRFA
jgi:hypothetical protein